jgi:hypothetical protein
MEYIHTFSRMFILFIQSEGAAAAILASEAFVKKHNLEHQAVEIIGITYTPLNFSSFCCDYDGPNPLFLRTHTLIPF